MNDPGPWVCIIAYSHNIGNWGDAVDLSWLSTKDSSLTLVTVYYFVLKWTTLLNITSNTNLRLQLVINFRLFTGSMRRSLITDYECWNVLLIISSCAYFLSVYSLYRLGYFKTFFMCHWSVKCLILFCI